MNEAWHERMAAVDADIDRRESLARTRPAGMAHRSRLAVTWSAALSALAVWI